MPIGFNKLIEIMLFDSLAAALSFFRAECVLQDRFRNGCWGCHARNSTAF
jgi:hypothetical protein